MTMLPPVAKALAFRTYNRYILASGFALSIDLACFLSLITLGFAGSLASASAYAVGVLVHWFACTRFVFQDGLATSGSTRVRQKRLFVTTGLLGVGITTLIVTVSVATGIDPLVAKAIAVIVSFNAIYLTRRIAVFAA